MSWRDATNKRSLFAQRGLKSEEERKETEELTKGGEDTESLKFSTTMFSLLFFLALLSSRTSWFIASRILHCRRHRPIRNGSVLRKWQSMSQADSFVFKLVCPRDYLQFHVTLRGHELLNVNIAALKLKCLSCRVQSCISPGICPLINLRSVTSWTCLVTPV